MFIFREVRRPKTHDFFVWKTAARILKDAGHRIRILESSNRVGGRILTYRNFDEKWQIELGGMRIPKDHVLTRELVKIGTYFCLFSIR